MLTLLFRRLLRLFARPVPSRREAWLASCVDLGQLEARMRAWMRCRDEWPD